MTPYSFGFLCVCALGVIPVVGVFVWGTVQAVSYAFAFAAIVVLYFDIRCRLDGSLLVGLKQIVGEFCSGKRIVEDLRVMETGTKLFDDLVRAFRSIDLLPLVHGLRCLQHRIVGFLVGHAYEDVVGDLVTGTVHRGNADEAGRKKLEVL